ncbi:MAG: hypothetical protein LWX07_08095 [Bacteroidetes bacterium]|nr:hypothetical protein [Bacteroidota bacterium]
MLVSFFIALSFTASAQSNAVDRYYHADSLLNSGKTFEAYKIYKDILPGLNYKDTLYEYTAWYYTYAVSLLENDCRMKEDFTNSLKYGLEAYNFIRANKYIYDKEYAEREQWMIKNIIVSYFGLNKLDEAEKYKAILYKGYKNNTLPTGIEQYFNFDFFKLDGKNVWGYEWFQELPEDRNSMSFTKVVYYVYSTNEDGSDKDQLYRFHVLMFHQDPINPKFDYILEKQQEIEGKTFYYSYYEYNYKKDIDYLKLRSDVKKHIQNKIPWSSMRYYNR